MPRRRAQNRQEQLRAEAAQPIYLSMQKSIWYGSLFLGAWAVFCTFIALGFYFSLFSQASISAGFAADARQGIPGFSSLFIGAGAIFFLMPYFAIKYFKNAYHLYTDSVPAQLYLRKINHEQRVVNNLKTHLALPVRNAFIRTLDRYITNASTAKFDVSFGEKLEFPEYEYDKLKTLEWVHKKLQKLVRKPARERQRYQNKILAKANTNFNPFLDMQRRRNEDERVRDAEVAEKDIFNTWQNDVMPRFR